MLCYKARSIRTLWQRLKSFRRNVCIDYVKADLAKGSGSVYSISYAGILPQSFDRAATEGAGTANKMIAMRRPFVCMRRTRVHFSSDATVFAVGRE